MYFNEVLRAHLVKARSDLGRRVLRLAGSSEGVQEPAQCRALYPQEEGSAST